MKFTIADLKKELAKRTKEQIIQEISTLCQRFPQVREYYRSQADDTDDIVNKYKEIIEKEFVEGKARGFPKARLSVARKSVNDFKKITGSNGFCGQTLHPRRDPATSMFWSQLEWYWNPFSASKGEARAPS